MGEVGRAWGRVHLCIFSGIGECFSGSQVAVDIGKGSSSSTSAPHEQHWGISQLLILFSRRPVGSVLRQNLLIHCRFFFARLQYAGRNRSQSMTSKVVELHPIRCSQYWRSPGNSSFSRSVGLRFRVMVQP